MPSPTLYKMYINGEWISSASGEMFDVINPANSEVIARVPKGNAEDAKRAVDAARHAFDRGSWSKKTVAERSKVLWKLADLVEQNLDFLATLESKNQGKTIKYSRESDFPFIIDNLRFFAGACRMLEGKAAAEYSGMGTSIIRREPLGVVAGIVPWNYPLYIAVWKFAPALAAGNSVIIKPASYTPLTTLEVAKLAEKAGVPKGVFNIVTGPGEIVGTALAENKKVDMISLTGDTETGKKIMSLAAANVKRVHLELGGKAPLIILLDADLRAAIEGAVVGAFWNTGQDCTAVTRVYAPEKIRKKISKHIAARAKKFRIGNQLDEKTDMGPMVSFKQREHVEKYILSGKEQGAKIAFGGERPAGKIFEKGAFLKPTIFTNVHEKMKICQEEIFGPVVTVHGYSDINDAIEKANNTIYGLASSVWGKNIIDCMKVANALNFGTVWINEHGILVSEMPHGGFKQSGFGKDLSLYSFEEYTRIKHVYIDQTGLARKPWHYVVYGEK